MENNITTNALTVVDNENNEIQLEKNYDDTLTYHPELSLLYLSFNYFKQTNANYIQALIGGSRLNEYIKFSSYGDIEFTEEDHKHQYPIIIPQDGFINRHTRVLIYDMLTSHKNHDKYDKLFIYVSNKAKNKSEYGYIMFNTKTKKTYHHFLVGELYDDITTQLNIDLNILSNSVLHKYYITKSKSIKAYNGNNNVELYGTVTDYKNAIIEHRQKLSYSPDM